MAASVLFVNTRPSPLETEPCYDAARRVGLDVVLLADRPVPVADGLVREHVPVDTYDIDALVTAARDAARRHDVAGVVCWGDRDVEGAAAVSEALGLPGNTRRAGATARNKFAMRNALHATHPHLVPAFAHVRDRDELEAALDSVPLPAILKPAGASSSKGIFAIGDRADAVAAYETLSRYADPSVDPIFRYYPGELILEQRIDGTEHSVEGIVRDGRLVAAAVTDKWVTAPFFIEYLQVHPTVLDEATQQRVLDATAATIAAAGLGTSAFHLELKVTADGRPMVLELNARTGGGYITTHLLALSRRYPFLDEVLVAACDLAPTTPMTDPHIFAGSQQVISTATGTLAGFADLHAALSVPGVQFFAQDAPLGTKVAQPPNSYTTSVLGSVVARAATSEGVVRVLDEATRLVRPIVE